MQRPQDRQRAVAGAAQAPTRHAVLLGRRPKQVLHVEGGRQRGGTLAQLAFSAPTCQQRHTQQRDAPSRRSNQQRSKMCLAWDIQVIAATVATQRSQEGRRTPWRLSAASASRSATMRGACAAKKANQMPPVVCPVTYLWGEKGRGGGRRQQVACEGQVKGRRMRVLATSVCATARCTGKDSLHRPPRLQPLIAKISPEGGLVHQPADCKRGHGGQRLAQRRGRRAGRRRRRRQQGAVADGIKHQLAQHIACSLARLEQQHLGSGWLDGGALVKAACARSSITGRQTRLADGAAACALPVSHWSPHPPADRSQCLDQKDAMLRASQGRSKCGLTRRPAQRCGGGGNRWA